ncbi:MAG: bifunctional homocysteine S-methyltransferase/methylenetetrahydrofolate reductase [Eubacteriales bacterium]|nr:bifunctional homocysteine S-methyltransferase/methylenetetrahydrofolate reductase [Eubacteriales bacterium]
MQNIREYLKEHRLLTDGAMGTYFDLLEQEEMICSEEANLTKPELIKKIHHQYIDSGANLIRSNTFSANKDTLEQIQLKTGGFRDLTLKDFVKAGYRIAKETEKEARAEGKMVWAAADIGPLVEHSEREREEILEQYYEICDAFLEEGCKVYVLETFPEEYYVIRMASYIKEKEPHAFLLGQFTFMQTGYGSTGHHFLSVLKNAAECNDLDAIGLNCGVGAFHMEDFFDRFLEEWDGRELLLSALPNSGYPQIVRGKVIYSDSLPYYSENLKRIASKGVRILGGCCGTTPDYIAAISRWITEENLVFPTKIFPASSKEKQKKAEKRNNTFADKIKNGKQVIAVELDPPFDVDCGKLMSAAEQLCATKADIITLADSPLARARADSLIMAAKIKRETGMDVMPHMACRDRNRIAIRSGILGAYINEIHNFLFVTGDPVPRADRDNTKAVFDFNSIGCMRYVKQMNDSLFQDNPVFYGGALNQDGANLEAIAKRMVKKIEEGCSYFMSQPVYSNESMERLRRLKEMTGARILVGILPLVSHRNAIFMQNEMPGIVVPDEVVALYKPDASREEWEKVSVDFSIKMMQKCENIGAGYYMMTPFNRVSLIKNILDNY